LFEFSPFVNVIQGPSTVGKTSILRAYRLLTKNRPSGGKFFSNFAGFNGETRIDLGMTGASVSLIKSIHKTKSGKKDVLSTNYKVNFEGKDFDFNGVGENVPDVVAAALNLSDLNLQRQFEPPFLVSSATSAGEIARTINRITNLEQTDEWVSSLTSKIDKNNANIVLLETEIKGIQDDLELYSDLEETRRIVADLSAISANLNKLVQREKILDALLVEYETKRRSQDRIEEFARCERYLIKIDKLQAEINKYDRLVSILSEYEAGALKITGLNYQSLEVVLVQLEDSIYTGNRNDSFISLCERGKALSQRQEVLGKEILDLSLIQDKIDKAKVDRTKMMILFSLTKDLNQLQESGATLSKCLADSRAQYVEHLRKIGQCPSCLTEKLTEDQMARIEREI
jgi:hypothetical protein